MLKKGTTLLTVYDEYIVESQINQGGNGVIYNVRDSLGEHFALKAIDIDKTTVDKRKRFRNELAFCENENHKNIIKIIDSGTFYNDENKIIFYIMPLYQYTLRDKIKNKLNPDEVLPLFYQLLDALKYAHQKQIWHRDIKPENILVDSEGNIVLADFGIAHFCSEEIITTVETKNGDRLANFMYAAPEQRIKMATVDGRADIFAAGLILNEMFTNKVIAGVKYHTVEAVAKNYSYLDEIINSMICQNPDDRLFPIEKVALRIAAAQSSEKANQALLKLAEIPSANDVDITEIPIPQVLGADYKNGTLYIHLKDLNYYYSQTWFAVLQGGQYSHSCLNYYEPSKLKLVGNDLSISVHDASPQIVSSIASHIKDWLIPATEAFNSNMRQKSEQEKRKKAQEVEAEIKRLKAEVIIRNELNNSFQ